MGSRYHPRCETTGSTAARRAVAPAGGWTVFVKVMAADASPHAIAPATHRRLSKWGLNLKSLVIVTPTTAEMKCPTMEFRGWARGDSIVLYSRMAAAPFCD